MTVRAVRPDDAAGLADLFSHIDTTYFRPHPMTADGALAIADYVGRDVYLVGSVGAELIAYGMLRGWDEGYVVPSLGIAVRTSHVRHGHGRAMMSALHAVARSRGASAVRLRVAPGNRGARRLYAALGYEDIGEEREERVMLLRLR
jgi:ribosomal protein S18 acetylase RimI-like enzyme